VKCLFNLSKREQTIELSDFVEENDTVLLHGSLDAASEENLTGEITLQPWEFWIIASEGENR
jgi:hypothetical protein